MKNGSRHHGLVSRLRASVDGALTRLARSQGAPSQSAGPQDLIPDPTNVLFPGAAPRDDEFSDAPLVMMLEESAHAIARRKDELRMEANRLAARLSARRDGELTLVTQSLRFLIGLGWALVGVWLYLSGFGVFTGGFSAGALGVPAADAAVLARMFLMLGLVGMGVAFAATAVVSMTGNGGNEKIRQEAEQLGLFIADASYAFDADLTRLREEMDNRSNPADAVIDLSRAHLTALEATSYFRDISFLTGTEGEEAALRFRKFLSRPSAAPPGEAFLVGLLVGAFFTFAVYGPKPDLAAVSLPEIAKYPWAANLLLFGGVLYAMVGLILTPFAGAVTDGATARARMAALDALRGAFTSRQAPRPADVIRRIEDAVDVFRARVSGRRPRGGRDETNHASADFSEAGEIPEWRRRDSSVKFVETEFHLAPAEWRADAYAKKFERGGRRDTASKRGVFSGKKGRRD